MRSNLFSLFIVLLFTSNHLFSQGQLNLYFKSNEYKLTDLHKQKLDQYLSSLKQGDYYHLVTGFTDSVGSVQSNLILGENRAQSVQNYLISKKAIKASAIETKSNGEKGSTLQKRSSNRRVSLAYIVNIQPKNTSTIIATGKEGSVLTSLTGGGYKVNITEILDVERMIDNNLFPLTTSERGLFTGGMANLVPKTDEDATAMAKDTVTFCMPALRKLDGLTLWRIQLDNNGNERWVDTDIPFEYNEETKQYCITTIGSNVIRKCNADIDSSFALAQYHSCFILENNPITNIQNAKCEFASSNKKGEFIYYNSDTLCFMHSEAQRTFLPQYTFHITGKTSNEETVSFKKSVRAFQTLDPQLTNNGWKDYFKLDLDSD